ncbi:MAG TPA: hypothetical protein VF528_17035 [Pyrinomonadaceae bacterium]
MKKVLTTLLMLVSLAGVTTAAGVSATERDARAQATSLVGGSPHTLLLQNGRRMRRRWRRARWNRGRTDNTWNRGRRWDNRRRWNRGRTDNTWNRGRRNRGGGHGRH